MEIPENLQNILKCSECNEYLSCGPVYLLHRTEGIICGRCSQEPEDEIIQINNGRTRIAPYEATASLLIFPCPFAVHGCPEKLPFSIGRPAHESCCKFRPFPCPIRSPAACDWSGPWPNLQPHFRETHPENILENPCNPPRPDLTTANLKSYLIPAFNFLFLLQLKICLTSGKILHSVRMYGDAAYLDKFSFKLDAEGNKMKFAKAGTVLRPGNEPNLVYTTINCLAGILNAPDSQFTLRIQALFKYCANCLKPLESEVDSRFCAACTEILIKCKFHEQNCAFVDVHAKKCSKHEQFFCKYQTKCKCDVAFSLGGFIEHMESSSSCRKTSTSHIDAVFRLTRNIDNNMKIIILSRKDADTVICEYKLSDNVLMLRVFTAHATHDLKDFKCSVKLTDPLTKHTLMLTPQIVADNERWDWRIQEEMYGFASWRKHGTDMKINIVKK